jgi:tRNA A-37 threonylcarbamoyl transferase component Bud32
MAMALDFLEKRKINHGDVTLRNMVLTSWGNAVLVDYGISATTDDQVGGRGHGVEPRHPCRL